MATDFPPIVGISFNQIQQTRLSWSSSPAGIPAYANSVTCCLLLYWLCCYERASLSLPLPQFEFLFGRNGPGPRLWTSAGRGILNFWMIFDTQRARRWEIHETLLIIVFMMFPNFYFTISGVWQSNLKRLGLKTQLKIGIENYYQWNPILSSS